MEDFVDSCPQNITAVLESSTRLGCGQDKYGNNQYICVPNTEKSSLIELCYNGIMGMKERGHCLEINGGKLYQIDCLGFSSGCPEKDFRSNKIYEYPACQSINTQHNCYLAEPSCPNTTWDANLQTTASPQDDSTYVAEIVGSVVAAVVLILVVLLTLAFVFWKRRKRQETGAQERISTEAEELLPAKRIEALEIADPPKQEDDTQDQRENNGKKDFNVNNASILPECMESVLPIRNPDDYGTINEQVNNISNVPEEGKQCDTEATINDITTESGSESQLITSNDTEGQDEILIEAMDIEIMEKHCRVISQGDWRDYNLWKTKLSDQFSTLTDDEVSVLYCFLWSDSGPPDFADTEWLHMLNVIGQNVFDKGNPVTSEQAQQTLDRLQSRDFLWEDRDKIKKDIKNETMYKIASIVSDIPFFYSSYDTASVYLRSKRYNRKPGEKCVISLGYDPLLIRRLQMNILTHVTMEDTRIYDNIYQILILNVPENILKDSKDKREEFLMDLRKGGEVVHYRGRSQDSVQHVTWLWRYGRYGRPDIVRSCIGLHPHNDIYIIDNKAYRKPSKYHNYSPDVRCLLYCLLLAEKYQLNVNEQSYKIKRDKIRDRYFTDFIEDGSVNLPDGIVETQNGVIMFTSDDIRYDVMYAFVTECLVKDSDLKFFLSTASRNVISEYCRLWHYERSEGERCLYIPRWPEEMENLFIDRLQLDIINHCTTSDTNIDFRRKISQRLGIPEEILQWDKEARERYVEYAKRGTQTVHHARGMIVGCAGAGKTTLLKRLLGCSEKEIQEVESTEGLEVHEEIFEVCDDTKSLKARTMNKDDKNAENSARNVDTKTLSFFDFGGQCAYYACHQIYLTRRAFYVVVVDASKRLDQKVDKKVCDQDGSVFSGWTYGDYFVFWIKSIHTYCGSANEKDLKPIVLIIATHWEEENRQYQDKDDLLYSLQQQLPKESNLSQYVVENNCYCTQFPVQTLSELEKRVFDIASHQRWKENIPKEWAFFEIEINQRKHSERILDIGKLTTKLTDNIDKEQENPKAKLKTEKDMLRYYHDAGKALYFNEKELEEFVIIDVQWFINAFKHIITDKLHFRGIDAIQMDWNEYYKTGNLENRLLTDIWKHEDDILREKLMNDDYKFQIGPRLLRNRNNDRYLLSHKEQLLSFMQRLGLMAVGQESHYVPCMNRKVIETAIPDLIHRSESKTSVLIYRFSFLPYFLFFRLVVSCKQLKDWEVLKTNETSCLYRNAALFSVHQYNIVLSVTETSIQLQVFHPVPGCSLEKDKTYNIQSTIEGILHEISGAFHRKLLYERGVRCQEDSSQTIAIDIKGHFVLDRYIHENDGKIICPMHPVTDQHFINTNEMAKFWNLCRDK